MARKLVVQGSFPVPLAPAEPVTLVALPKGFRGYVRVVWTGVAGADVMYASWTPTTPENVAQNKQALSATNRGMSFTGNDATREKLWNFAPEGMALMASASATGGLADVDAVGDIEDY